MTNLCFRAVPYQACHLTTSIMSSQTDTIGCSLDSIAVRWWTSCSTGIHRQSNHLLTDLEPRSSAPPTRGPVRIGTLRRLVSDSMTRAIRGNSKGAVRQAYYTATKASRINDQLRQVARRH